MNIQRSVGIFFCVNGKTLLHTCSLDDASHYGDFLNYPLSHDAVWSKYYQGTYGVDFDYWPRGRIIYNIAEEKFILYYDACAEKEAVELKKQYGDAHIDIEKDEHYQCHKCNSDYADISANLPGRG